MTKNTSSLELNKVQKEYLHNKLAKLHQSKFRSSFKLTKKDKNYLNDKGFSTIEEHAYNFIRTRLSPAFLPNDGKQTPFKGHPVFIAQHATATCCRQCLYKWHKIPPNRNLLPKEERFIVALILEWLKENNT